MDAARGIAIIMMIVYHSTYDLDTLGGYDILFIYLIHQPIIITLLAVTGVVDLNFS